MNILEQIVASKKTEVARQKSLISLSELEQDPLFARPVLSLRQSLLSTPWGIIAEFKRKSPSKGWIHPEARPQDIVPAYEKAGASGVSILTDTTFFGGAPQDIRAIRATVGIPVLRKDFMIDPYQVYEARAMGADVILLIAACLSPAQTAELAATARSLGLEVLLELHHEEELAHICEDITVVGINNRNLKTFGVDIQTSLRLARMLPEDCLKISESGISNPASVHALRTGGFRGFLMGEHFMSGPDPGAACRDFIKALGREPEQNTSLC
jgi:indole-3-glycerol phosphate synthase